MIQSISKYLQNNGITFETIVSIEPKQLGSRKKILILDCIDINKDSYAIFFTEQKSRFIQKTAQDIFALQTKLQEDTKNVYKNNIIFINAPLCSKAKKLIEDNNWSLFHDLV
ncbi:MAG TPA: hypothetical protein ENK66_08295 [Arcobacter sp.]|jgi:hypothetical protein|nr:hypothetical protein [Arcobacter sp.]